MMSREIAECLFNLNVSLFKGLQYFVHDTQVKQLISRAESRSNLHRRGDSGSTKYPIEEENFLLFLKDDVRPFILYLLHTRSFKVIILKLYL